jgi:hypothetical protein
MDGCVVFRIITQQLLMQIEHYLSIQMRVVCFV